MVLYWEGQDHRFDQWHAKTLAQTAENAEEGQEL